MTLIQRILQTLEELIQDGIMRVSGISGASSSYEIIPMLLGSIGANLIEIGKSERASNYFNIDIGWTDKGGYQQHLNFWFEKISNEDLQNVVDFMNKHGNCIITGEKIPQNEIENWKNRKLDIRKYKDIEFSRCQDCPMLQDDICLDLDEKISINICFTDIDERCKLPKVYKKNTKMSI
jgi:hypothetical protein